MRIDALLQAGGTRSFEFFPTKTEAEERLLTSTLRALTPLHPSFVSVTYRGGPPSRQRTFDLVDRIQRDLSWTAMAHLICVGHTKVELKEILENYIESGVTNLMALGGDVPDDPELARSEFRHAIELVELARESGDFSIGVAAHPSGHPRSSSRRDDRRFLAEKLRVADFAVTQFFFDATEWTELVAELADLGVEKPVLPGIIPLTSLDAVAGMREMGGVVPSSLISRLEAAKARGGPAAVRDEGIAAATELCRTLLDAGAPGVHLYTMNRARNTLRVYDSLYS